MGALIGIMLALWANGELSRPQYRQDSVNAALDDPVLSAVALLTLGTVGVLAALVPFGVIAWVVFKLAGG